MIENRILEIESLIPHTRNYRQHPDTQLSQLGASHERFGQFRSVVVVERAQGYTIVAGHGIVEAMKRNGVKQVRADVLPRETSEADIEAILIADNLLPQGASDDNAILVELLQEQVNAGFDLEALGSDEETLRQMVEALGDEYVGAGETGDLSDETLPENVPTRSRLGDIWQLGERHRIACINSCDPDAVRQFIGQEVVHFVFADPPYGIDIVATNGFVGGGEAYDIPFGGVKMRKGDVGGGAAHMRKTGKPYLAEQEKGLRGSIGASKPFGSKDVRASDRAANVVEVGKYFPVIGDDSTQTALVCYRLCAEYFPQALHVWWGANYYANALPPSSCWIVWDKENTGNFADAELAWCSDKSAVRIFKHMWNGMLKDSEQGQRRVHPTQKPCALAEYCFEKYGNEQDVIFDPFLGSGITVIAAERMNGNRKVYGCELSPEYIDVILARWERLTGQTATLLDRIEMEKLETQKEAMK